MNEVFFRYFLESAMVLPAAGYALLPVRNHLRYSKKQIFGVMLLLTLSYMVVQSLLIMKIGPTGEYMIIPAGKCEELVREGQQLHHCVGASDLYMDRMVEGKSWILFLRKKEDINTPYYTIEIDMESNKIKQWYSAFDRKPDEKKIQKLLSTFTKQITKPKAKIWEAG